ncbi:MAG: carboxylating nicotinate-nucleotide diphosphorylase [Dehalococcoidia bacterium]|nr:carboxylating nicotinate-nucleotide diphosphorylase [Dehalococcoidia bacterium]
MPRHLIEQVVIAALEEDGAFEDVTTRALVPPEQWGRGIVRAKELGVVCGIAVAAAAMRSLDAEVQFDPLIADAERVEAGRELAEVEGPLASILSAERVALNFLQRLSGIATLTDEYAHAVAGTRARILDTRKTTPGLRTLERYAVRCGGGQNHRFGLNSGVLIKDNHIAAARERGLAEIEAVVASARAAVGHTMRIEVEVATPDGAKEALLGGADVILLDNMSIADIRRSVAIIGGRAIVEASGGVTLDNVREIAEAGVDYISVGRLTHSAPALDISLDVGRV